MTRLVGVRTLNATLQRLHLGIDSCGVRVQPRHLLLAGLSNGARGASVLAPRFRRRFDGLILISGLASDARPPGMPTLVLHGRRDPAVPPAAAARYLSRIRSHSARSTPRSREAPPLRARVTHVILPGDHFVLLTRELRVRRSISRFLVSVLAQATP